LFFPQNVSGHLSIDETCLSHGELYTVVTNKEARGKKGTIVAILNGTKSENIIPILQKIPQRLRNKVQEITLDLDFLHSGACLGLLDRKSDLRFKISNSIPNSLLFKYSSFWG